MALALGFRVDVLIGDLDSVQAEPLPQHVVVEQFPADKDQTDLDLALELAMRESPQRVVVVGGGGGRHDHELANAALLCSERWSPIDELDWFTHRSRAYVVRQHRMIHGDVGTTLSLLALGGHVARGITTKGLRWELADAALEPGTTRGVSNVMRSPVADIRVAEGCLLVVIPGGPDQP